MNKWGKRHSAAFLALILVLALALSACQRAPQAMEGLPVEKPSETPAPSVSPGEDREISDTGSSQDWRKHPVFAGMAVRDPIAYDFPILLCSPTPWTDAELLALIERLDVGQPLEGINSTSSSGYSLEPITTVYGEQTGIITRSISYPGRLYYGRYYENIPDLQARSHDKAFVPDGMIDGYAFGLDDARAAIEPMLGKMGVELTEYEFRRTRVYDAFSHTEEVYTGEFDEDGNEIIKEEIYSARYPSYFFIYAQVMRGLPVFFGQYLVNGSDVLNYGIHTSQTEAAFSIAFRRLEEISVEQEKTECLAFDEFMSKYAGNVSAAISAMPGEGNSFEHAEIMYAPVPVASAESRVKLIPAWCFSVMSDTGDYYYAIFDAVTGRRVSDYPLAGGF